MLLLLLLLLWEQPGWLQGTASFALTSFTHTVSICY
jgi:hypothetical protein